MALITWHSIFSVGIDSIDRQHQQLFEIGNRLHESCQQRADRAVLCRIFDELFEYTGYHFAEEERLMQQIRYPDLARHRGYHEKLVALVRQYRVQMLAGVPNIETRALEFVKMWLTAHVLGTDREIGVYLAGRAVHGTVPELENKILS